MLFEISEGAGCEDLLCLCYDASFSIAFCYGSSDAHLRLERLQHCGQVFRLVFGVLNSTHTKCKSAAAPRACDGVHNAGDGALLPTSLVCATADATQELVRALMAFDTAL